MKQTIAQAEHQKKHRQAEKSKFRKPNKKDINLSSPSSQTTEKEEHDSAETRPQVPLSLNAATCGC